MKRFFAILLLCILLLLPLAVSAEPDTKALEDRLLKYEQQIIDLQNEVSSLKAEKESYEYLKNDTKEFRQYVQNERTEHQNFLERLYTSVEACMTILGVLIVGLIGYSGWSNKKELEDTIARTKEKLNNAYEEKLNSIVGEKLRMVQNDVVNLKKIMNRESYYINSKILFIVSNKSENLFKSFVTESLQERDIRNITIKPFSSIDDAYIKEIKQDGSKFDLIVYDYSEYEATEIGFTVHTKLISLMNALQYHKLPITIYAPKGISVNEENIKNYTYYSIVNMPMTLIHNIYTTIEIYRPTKICD